MIPFIEMGTVEGKNMQGLGVNVFSFEEVGFDFPGKDNETVTKRLLALWVWGSGSGGRRKILELLTGYYLKLWKKMALLRAGGTEEARHSLFCSV